MILTRRLRELTVGEVLNDALRVKVPFAPGTFRPSSRPPNRIRLRSLFDCKALHGRGSALPIAKDKSYDGITR